MRRARKKFSPPLWATLALVPAVAGCLWAGLWQLERRDAKAQLFAEFDASADSEPLGALVPNELAAGYRFRRFVVRGRYDSDRQVLLDSMVQDGKVGYQVLTPLLSGTSAVLVNRGWVPANPNRAVLPDITVNEQTRFVRGRLDFLRRPGLRIGSANVDSQPAGGARRMLYPTVETIEQDLGLALYDYQLLLDAQDPDGFVRRWRPQVLGPERHLGYAVQWFAFAALLCILYIVLNLQAAGQNNE